MKRRNFVKVMGLIVFIPKTLFGKTKKLKKQRVDWNEYVNPCPSIYKGCKGRDKENPRLFCYAYTKESCYVMSKEC